MNKRLLILILIGLAIFGFVGFIRFNNIETNIFANLGSSGWLIPAVTVAALIDSINPCAFSILILTVAFLFGLGRTRSNVLKVGGIYIFGNFLVYVLIGLGILQTLAVFNMPHFMARIGALLLVVWGVLELAGEIFPDFPIKLKIPHSVHHRMAMLMEKASAITAFILGGLVGLYEFPCTGGPYLMVLGLLHDSGTYLRGLWYLIYYNFIFVSPLIIILLIASDKNLIDRVKGWQQKERGFMRYGGGIAMIILGILIFLL